MTGRTARSDGAALLGKACDVLEAVGRSPHGIGQPELAARLGMPRATLYRILATLVARGLLRQDPTRRIYAVGFGLLEIAQGAWSAPDLSGAAAPELRALRDATGETAYIAVLEGGEAVGLGKFEGAHEVRSAARLGQRKPLYCTSQGKAMLAFLPGEQRDALIRKMNFTAMTPHTLRDRRQLLAALQIVRARGYAIDDEEIVEGIRCVGAPVIDAAGAILGAVSIAGPAWRMTPDRLELLGPEVALAGRRIGAAMRPAPSIAGEVVTVAGTTAFHGLCPRWGADGLLWWMDSLGPAVFADLPDGAGRIVARLGSPLTALVLTGEGCLVADTGGSLTRLRGDGTAAACRLGLPPGAWILAMDTDPTGALWVAVNTGQGQSCLGKLTQAGEFEAAWTLPTVVVDMAWSAGGDALFTASPAAGVVHRLEPGRAAPMILAKLPPGSGRPAALALDGEGGVWAALRDGWAVVRLSPAGEIDRLIPLPVPRPTGLGFGGPARQTLYVTTARDGIGLDVLASAPLSGRIFALATDTTGQAAGTTHWPGRVADTTVCCSKRAK